MNPSILWSLLRQTFAEWQRDKVSRLAAALAYYTAFALAPVLVIAIAVASFLFEQSTVQGRIIEQLRGLIGADGAEMVREMLVNAQSQDSNSFLATVVGVGLLILGASGLFIQLQDALNTVWNVKARADQGIWGLVRDRLLSFGMVLVIGFLLMVSLLLSTALTAASGLLGSNFLPGLDFFWQIANAVVAFGVIALLFGLIYKVLPDAKIGWSDVRIGAVITALLFTIGKWLIGLYLGNSSAASAYGAAGSFVVLLLWIYYSAQILLFGAEFTQVYANRFGSHIRPDEHATYAPDATAAERGETNLPQTRSEYKARQRTAGQRSSQSIVQPPIKPPTEPPTA